MQLNKNHAGLALGAFLAFVHLVWAIMVLIGIAKPIMDFVLSLHHIELVYSIMGFEILKAIGLLIVTFVLGYIFGWIFAYCWNKARK